jgi:endonuclease/exonuclease/phosphatase family metal-dependent hydrolase
VVSVPPVSFTTYNLLDLFADDSAASREHYEAIVGVIRSLDTDVLAVQEILAPTGRPPSAGYVSSPAMRACAVRWVGVRIRVRTA